MGSERTEEARCAGLAFRGTPRDGTRECGQLLVAEPVGTGVGIEGGQELWKDHILSQRLVPVLQHQLLRRMSRQVVTRGVQPLVVSDPTPTGIDEELTMQHDAVLAGGVRHLGDIGQSKLFGRQEDRPLQYQAPNALVCMRKHDRGFSAGLVRNAAPPARVQDGDGLGPTVVTAKRLERFRRNSDALRHQEPQVLWLWALICRGAGALQPVAAVVQPARANFSELQLDPECAPARCSRKAGGMKVA